MIELQLVGYAADCGHLVLDLVNADNGRYRLVVDPDLFATIDELREKRRERGLAVGDLVEFAEELGIAADRLQDLQDAEEQAAAAAGLVSSGAASATSVEVRALFDGRGADEPADEATIEADPHGEPEPAPEPEPEPESEPEAEPEPEPAPAVARQPARQPVGEVRDGPAASTWDLDEGSDDDEPRWVNPGVRVVPAPDPLSGEDGEVVRRLAERAASRVTEDGVAGVAGVSEEEAPPSGLPPQPDRTDRRASRPPDQGHAPAPARAGQPESSRPATPRPQPTLTPAEIQARLRAGKSVRAVAKAAGVDEDWVRRWEVPIAAERARILERARGHRLERSRLGRSSQPLGEAVRRNLSARGVPADDVQWEAARRRDGRWKVTVRYPSRGGRRSATWLLDVSADAIEATSDSARELGFIRRRSRSRSTG